MRGTQWGAGNHSGVVWENQYTQKHEEGWQTAPKGSKPGGNSADL